MSMNSDMQIHVDSDGTFRIAGRLDTSVAEALRNALVTCLQKHPAVALDLSGVEECGTAAVQLIYSARSSAAQAGKSFRITRVSAAVEKASTALGLRVENSAGDVQ